jgi:REP element-mobilizing transposase RayT
MSWVRVWIHLVFTTKNRSKILKDKKTRESLFEHISKNAKEKGIFLDAINGVDDHIHCLISLSKEFTISKTVKLIKGESSHWFNAQLDVSQKLFWQDDYWAVSVSESHIAKIREYINKQETHHKTKTFVKEVEEFMDKYGWHYHK